MSASGPRERSNRKGQFSCNFCRTRKLRCDRPLPCTSCRSRGKTCEFNPTPTTTTIRQPNEPTPTGPILQRQSVHVRQPPVSTVDSQSVLSLQTPDSNQDDLLAEVQALRRRTNDLEQRIVQSLSIQQLRNHEDQTSVSPAASVASGGLPTPASTHGEVSDIVSHLQIVSMSQISQELVGVDDVVFKVENIRMIPQAPPFIARLGKPTACIWLPTRSEARVLLGHYIESISRIQHIVHRPSLPAMVEDAYGQIEGQKPLKPGHIVMLLSIIASATHVWVCFDNNDSSDSLFLSPAQAHAQTSMWIKAADTVLYSAQNSPGIELETIQGILILGCVLCNIEGVSLRYRRLMSTAMVLGRELGLHRIDKKSNVCTRGTLWTEMGRRIWWYMVATEWLMAARFDGPSEGVYQTHPLHMAVNKPYNINDVDIIDNKPLTNTPYDHSTDMSYFLQRIRLAEISRSIVDHNLINSTTSNQPNYYAHIMAMDIELDQLMKNVPQFFRLSNYAGSLQCNTTEVSFFQAYMLNSMVHLQRCKLHLAYLTTGPSENPAYAASRDACLRSARQLLLGESQLLQSGHPFVEVRLRLAATLYGIFMASIVLLMDTCLHRPESLEHDISNGNLAEALRMVHDVKSHSLAAATLHESLMQIVARYRAQNQHSANPAAILSMRSGNQHALTPLSDTLLSTGPYSNWTGDTDVNHGQFANSAEQEVDGPDDSMFLHQVQWDDLFTGLASSSFF